MSHPYLKHPKVHDWSGGRKSGLGSAPYKKIRTRYAMIEAVYRDAFIPRINEVCPNNKVVIYGMSLVGKVVVNQLKDEFDIEYLIDKEKPFDRFGGIMCFSIDELEDKNKDGLVIIALERDEDDVKNMLQNMGYNNIVGVRDIMNIGDIS